MTTKTRGGVRAALTALWLPVLLVAVWWFASANSTSIALPSLQRIVSAMQEEWFFAKFWTDFIPSVVSVLIAMAFATIVGVSAGLAIGSSRIADTALRPLLDFMRGIPPILLLAPALVIIGIGPGLALFVLTFGAVWPILLSTIDGVKGISSQLLDLRRTYRLSRTTWVLRVALPAASPQIFAGARTSLAIAVVLLVAAQAVGASSGLGYQLKTAADFFRFPEVWGTTIMFALLGYILNVLLLGLLERRLLRWFHAQGDIS